MATSFRREHLGKNLMTINCPDCLADDKVTVPCLFDPAQKGDRCPRCDRVYTPLSPMNHKHYATAEGAKRAMRRDGERDRHDYSAPRGGEADLQGRI